jgi:hypothetical protein
LGRIGFDVEPFHRCVGCGPIGPNQACGSGESQLPEQPHHIPPNRFFYSLAAILPSIFEVRN